MTPEQLRGSVLQFAIQGKLVDHRIEDGNAKDILQKITKKKNAMIKKGVAKKSKTLTAISDDEKLFDIPENWQWIKLGEIASLITKGTTPRGGNVAYLDEGIGFLRAENVAGLDILNKSNLKYIDEETHNGYLKRSIIEVNDILITIAGTLGRTGLVREEDLPLNANQAVSIVRLVDVSDIDFKYIIYVLNSPEVQKYLTQQKKTTAIPNLTLEIIENCVCPLPPLKEQHRIVAKIEELLPYVERYAETYNNLETLNTKFPEDMKKSILQYAIQGKLVEQRAEEGNAEELYNQIQEEKQKLIKEGKIKKEKPLAEIAEDEIPFDIPDSWKWVRVSTIGITQTGNTPKKSHLEYFGSDIPFLGPGDIQNGIINYENQGLSNEGKKYGRITPANSILQVCIGGSIGKCALVDREVTFNQQINSIYPLIANSEYIYHILDSTYFKNYMQDNAGGTATPIINRGLWDAIVIPLPPLKEQHRIVAKIEELLPYCDQLIK